MTEPTPADTTANSCCAPEAQALIPNRHRPSGTKSTAKYASTRCLGTWALTFVTTRSHDVAYGTSR